MKTPVACLSLLALFIVVPSAFSLSDQCQSEKDAAKACVQAIFKDVDEDREAKKAAKDSCFVNNGCESPSTLREIDQARREQLNQCKKAAMEELKPQMESCIQETVPGFTFPEFPAGKEEQGFGGRRHGKGRRGGKRGGRKDEMLQALCPTQETQDAAQECLQSFRGNRRSQRGGRRGNRNEMKQCFEDNVSEECQVEAEETKAALCACGAETLANNEVIVQDLIDCNADVGLDEDDDEDVETPEEISKKLVSRFCQKGKGRKGGRGQGSRSGGRRRTQGSRNGSASEESQEDSRGRRQRNGGPGGVRRSGRFGFRGRQ